MLELINKIDFGLTQEEYYTLLSEADCSVVEVNLPTKCRGFSLSGDGGYIIYVNSLLSERQKKKTLKHEFMHLFNNHFLVDIDIKDKENI